MGPPVLRQNLSQQSLDPRRLLSHVAVMFGHDMSDEFSERPGFPPFGIRSLNVESRSLQQFQDPDKVYICVGARIAQRSFSPAAIVDAQGFKHPDARRI